MAEMEDLDLDQLEDLMRNPEKIAETLADEGDDPEPEKAVTGDPDPAKIPEPEKPAPEPEKAVEESPEELERKELRAALEESDARAKHFEKIAGRNAGRTDYVERELKAIRADLSKRGHTPDETRDTDSYEEDPPERAPRRTAPETPARDSLVEWAIGKAMAGATQDFANAHPDFRESPEIRKGVVEYVRTLREQGGSDFGEDPVQVERGTMSVLEEAYWHTITQMRAKARQEFTVKRADQVRNMEELKRKSAISGAGGPATSIPTPPTIENMSEKDLSDLLEDMTRKR